MPTAPHCFHRSEYQHNLPAHEDVFCCWCTLRQCRDLTLVPLPGHGPHAPHVYMRTPDEIAVCPARTQPAWPLR